MSFSPSSLLQEVGGFVRTMDGPSLYQLVLSLPSKYKTWWLELYNDAPIHIVVETALVLFILWLVFIRRTVDPAKTSESSKFSEKDVKWLVDTWEPEPLVPAVLNARAIRRVQGSMAVVEAVKGNYLTIKGVDTPVLNLGSYDFLNQSQNPETKQIAKETLTKYGVGSCGPRGFYGTIDLHLQFEKAIAEHLGVQEAISYSDGASAVSSTITAFAKRGDLLLVDEACGEPIRTGANLSRAIVHYFKHNDMNHLRSIMASIASDDKRLKRDSTQQRRFIIVEGLFKETGNICPLPQIMALKEEFFYRLILDESLSFGSIGATGKGVTEHFNVPIKNVEMLVISMGSALASVGGVSLGTREVVDHQRLSGPGYCFSASAPPFFSACALASLAVLQDKSVGGKLLDSLVKNSRVFYDELVDIAGVRVVTECPEDDSVAAPIIHLALDESNEAVAASLKGLTGEAQWDAQESIISEIVNDCVQNGVGVTLSIIQSDWIEDFVKSGSAIRPTFRICVSSKLLQKDIKNAAKVIKESVARILNAKKSSRKSISRK